LRMLEIMFKNTSRLQYIFQILFIGLVVAVILAQANPLYQIPNRDSGFFLYAGNQLLKGKQLYADIWDSKGPLIFYLNALALWLGHGSRWGVWAVEYIFLYFAALLGFKSMKNLWGLIPAIVGTMIWLFAFNNVARGGNFTEEYSLLFNFIAISLYILHLSRMRNIVRPFLIGITLALSFLLRANNIGVQLSIAFVIIISGLVDKTYKQNLYDLIWIALGSSIVLILTGLYFLYLGTFSDMYQAALIFNFFYSKGGTQLSNLVSSVKRGANLIGTLFLIPAALGGLIVIEELPRLIRSGTRHLRDLDLLFLVGWLVEFVMSGLSGNNYPHYYICWVPYIGFLSGLLFYHLIPATNRFLNARPVPILMATIFLVGLSQLTILNEYRVSFGKLFFDRSSGVEYNDPVVKYIREHTDPTDTVLVWGAQPYINFMAHRDAPTGILFYPLLAPSPFTDQLNSRFLNDLEQKKPKLIVDKVDPNNDAIPFIDPSQLVSQTQKLKGFSAPSNLNTVFNFIHSNYHMETKIQQIVIYRLNDSSQ